MIDSLHSTYSVRVRVSSITKLLDGEREAEST